MSELKHSIKNEIEVRCFNVIKNEKDKRYGLPCGQLLMKKNSLDQAAGEIKCKSCKAVYEILNSETILIER